MGYARIQGESGHSLNWCTVTIVRSLIAATGARWICRICCKIDPYMRASWSQEGEDLILGRLLEDRRDGFYVDVGAHHPLRFSNTAYFSVQGWSGINIEPDPDGAALLARLRPRDITLNVGIGTTNGRLPFHRFDDPALNTFDAMLAANRLQTTGYRFRELVEVPVMRLDEVLDQHLPTGRHIDFLTVDAEGNDADVLASNNWRRFRPTIVLAELLEASFAEVPSSQLGRIMEKAGYRPVAMTLNSVFFREFVPKAQRASPP